MDNVQPDLNVSSTLKPSHAIKSFLRYCIFSSSSSHTKFCWLYWSRLRMRESSWFNDISKNPTSNRRPSERARRKAFFLETSKHSLHRLDSERSKLGFWLLFAALTTLATFLRKCLTNYKKSYTAFALAAWIHQDNFSEFTYRQKLQYCRRQCNIAPNNYTNIKTMMKV